MNMCEIEQVELVARKLAVTITVPNELLEDSRYPPSISVLFNREMAMELLDLSFAKEEAFDDNNARS